MHLVLACSVDVTLVHQGTDYHHYTYSVLGNLEELLEDDVSLNFGGKEVMDHQVMVVEALEDA